MAEGDGGGRVGQIVFPRTKKMTPGRGNWEVKEKKQEVSTPHNHHHHQPT